jgi:hypothetical protein
VVFLVIGCTAAIAAADPRTSTSYTPYHFTAHEGWRLQASGDLGASRINGGKLTLDFSRGADSIALTPPDRVLLGNVGKVRLHLRSSSAAHPLRLTLRTHFMNFHKVVPVPAADSEQDIVIDGPPGSGWQWSEGENDGRIHGPLRLGQLRFDANNARDQVSLELLSITVEGQQPANKLCVLTAHAQNFTADVRCLASTALTGELSWTFRDWDNNELGRGKQSITVPASAETASLSAVPKFKLDAHKFVEAEFQLAIPEQDIAPARACWTAEQQRHTDSELRPTSPFGMGVYLQRYQGPDLERAASVARDAGVKWSREGFSWGRIEPRRGQFDWTYYDNLIAIAKRYGISIYGLIHGWAPWTKPYTPEGIADYLAFTRELVRHYRSDVHHWEIWNEPNIFFWQGPRDMYAELLRRAYATIKEADPAAKVLGMSTSGIDYNFIARTMSLDAPFDILTIHPYRKVLNDRALINELRIAGDLVKGRPVWITEFGWTTLTPHNTISQDFAPFTERQQAEFLARAYLCGLAAGGEPNISWYDFRNDGDDPLYFENEMGILHRDFSPKPAYWSYATLTRLLEGKKLTGPVNVAEGVLAFRFGNVLAMWSPDKDQNVAVPRGILVNAIGESKPITTTAIALKAGAPVYIVTE